MPTENGFALYNLAQRTRGGLLINLIARRVVPNFAVSYSLLGSDEPPFDTASNFDTIKMASFWQNSKIQGFLPIR